MGFVGLVTCGQIWRTTCYVSTELTVLFYEIRRVLLVLGKNFDNGEFDPGSERTLAAWIRHASRTRKHPSGCEYSGERESNAWETYH